MLLGFDICLFSFIVDAMQPLSSVQIQDAVDVLQSHVNSEVLRIFGRSFHCHLDVANCSLAVDTGSICSLFVFYFSLVFYMFSWLITNILLSSFYYLFLVFSYVSS